MEAEIEGHSGVATGGTRG